MPAFRARTMARYLVAWADRVRDKWVHEQIGGGLVQRKRLMRKVALCSGRRLKRENGWSGEMTTLHGLWELSRRGHVITLSLGSLSTNHTVDQLREPEKRARGGGLKSSSS